MIPMRKAVCVAVLVLFAVGCASRKPLPVEWVGKSLSDVWASYRGKHSVVQSYTSEAVLTFRKSLMKVEADAVVAVMKPGFIRVDMMGPHGGVVWAVAVDGEKARRLDFMQQTSVEVEATPASLDTLLGIGSFGLQASEWLDVLNGTVQIPAYAAMDYDDRKGCWVCAWEREGATYKACVGSSDLRLLFFERLHKQKPVVKMEYLEWDKHGLPSVLNVVVSEPKSMRSEVKIAFQERDVASGLDPGLFQWDIPEGFTDAH
jgi:outer membrane lipoprotein-sorting protein